jgi:hypothetical protein
MQQIGPYGQQRLHATVYMYSQNVEALAAVSSAKLARSANAAVHIWIDGTSIANFDACLVRSYLDDLARQFVPQHAGIGIGRVMASQGMEIAATHSDAADSNQRVLASRLGDRNLSFNQFAGRI